MIVLILMPARICVEDDCWDESGVMRMLRPDRNALRQRRRGKPGFQFQLPKRLDDGSRLVMFRLLMKKNRGGRNGSQEICFFAVSAVSAVFSGS